MTKVYIYYLNKKAALPLLRYIIKRISSRAGINKEIHPYQLRHSLLIGCIRGIIALIIEIKTLDIEVTKQVQ
ncbi:hypothetical protein IEC97_28390 [Neobacillus cucumis]|uniref:hypothetical protein n=1 Tax=Neobacillus cucumis TaxID=1740721 RepID=UPI0018E0129D|nr:hypothetical protein [Neobacillus cucumis]MBI0581235.1 hypothetical protein [Neobacillus cucumis]